MTHDHDFSFRRIEMFSDGVFAIIVTLLVLDLKVPEISSNASMQETMNSLYLLAPQFISFTMSFLIVCIFWVNHHQFFSALKKADRTFMWLNNILLFWLCFIPFPTAFIGRHPFNIAANMLFGAVLLLAGASFSILSHYVLFKSNLYDEHVDIKERKDIQRRGVAGVIIYALSVLLAPVSVYISLTIFFIAPIFYFLPRKINFS